MSSVAPIGVIDHYNLLERLPAAGPGELFRARDTRRGRTVVVRQLPANLPDADARPEFVERARSLAALSHPNATRLYELGETPDGALYLAFEFLQGQSLRAEMAGRPLPVRRAVGYAIQIADAIAGAHAAGYLHGGLSPDTVTITAKGHAKIPVLDLATRTGFEPASGQLLDYPSPEELAGVAPDERSDVFSTGAILYEMVTGRRPSPRGSAAPSASNARVPRELDTLLLSAVAPDPERRYATARALVDALRGVAALLDQRDGDDDETPVVAAARRDTSAGAGAARRVSPTGGTSPRVVTPAGAVAPSASGMWLLVGLALAVAGLAAWWFSRG